MARQGSVDGDGASNDKDAAWMDRWITGVASGTATMSQRALTAIQQHGGLDNAVTLATARGVHLVQLTDDKGNMLVAASLHPFKTLC